MGGVLGMEILEDVTDLNDETEDLVDLRRFATLRLSGQPILERLAGDEIHDDAVGRALHEEVVDDRQRRVLELREKLRLRLDHLDPLRSFLRITGWNLDVLECDFPIVDPGVSGAIDATHSARGDRTKNLPATIQDRVGL